MNRSVTPSVFIVLPTDPTVAHAHDRILNSTHIFRGGEAMREGGQATRLQLCTTFCENTGETVTTHFFWLFGTSSYFNVAECAARYLSSNRKFLLFLSSLHLERLLCRASASASASATTTATTMNAGAHISFSG